MSIAGSGAMGTPFLHELKKQASFFFREKVKNARLALTDVTPAELMAEEATNGNLAVPDAKTMSFISRSAFEIDDYWRIVEILHKRLSKFDRKRWREPYGALMLLEHLLTHGPESTAEEFQCDKEVIEDMGTFQYIDERGFNWGLTVRKKSEWILKLLEKGTLLKEERNQARKISRGIQGFGSMNYRCPSDNDSDSAAHKGWNHLRKCNSQYEHYDDEQEDVGPVVVLKEISNSEEMEKEKLIKGELVGVTALPAKGLVPEGTKPFLACVDNERPKLESRKEDHPFDNDENQSMESTLLLSRS